MKSMLVLLLLGMMTGSRAFADVSALIGTWRSTAGFAQGNHDLYTTLQFIDDKTAMVGATCVYHDGAVVESAVQVPISIDDTYIQIMGRGIATQTDAGHPCDASVGYSKMRYDVTNNMLHLHYMSATVEFARLM